VQSLPEASTDTAPAPCGTIPSIAQAYSLNLTVVPHAAGAVYYVTIWPSGAAQSIVSTINDSQGLVVANAAIVPAGTPSGGVSVYSSGPATTDVIIDMNGFYAAPTDANSNTAVGLGALASNTTGFGNTASGGGALQSNTTGSSNTASGSDALANNTTGSLNTASGGGALGSNSTGGDNTATGAGALADNTIGNMNTASGFSALMYSKSGNANTASGAVAMYLNTTGSANTASGVQALYSNTTGAQNTASGFYALGANTTGSNNIAIGYMAGAAVTGSNNVDIGSPGLSTDNATIRIGTAGTQTSFFAAGVSGVTTGLSGAVNVVVDGNGQLGTISSSQRFKEDIEDMGEASAGLLDLRPVTFRYKRPYADGAKPLDYGLIAEEVAEVYPDLVVRGKDGQIETVQYQKLTPMLLNELQKQNRHAMEQDETIRQQQEENQRQQEENRKLEARLAALEALLSGRAPAKGPAGQ
jgi:hypothetical protein